MSLRNKSQTFFVYKKPKPNFRFRFRLAESEGFEPPEQLLAQQISNLPRSTTPTTFQTLQYFKFFAKQTYPHFHKNSTT